MTLDSIITNALEQLDRSSDAQNVKKYQGRFTQYANEAQQDLAKTFPMHRTDTLSTSGKFYTTDLSKWATKILSVSQNGAEVDWDLGGEAGEIVCNAVGDVAVKYRYLPSPLQDVSAAPDVPEQLHQCIVTYVVAREKTGGDPTTQSGAGVHFQLYNEQKRMLGSLGAPSSYRFKNR